MGGRLTKEEHRARSMLLGWKYMPYLGYYFDYAPTNLHTQRWDADTMEPISYEQSIARRTHCENTGKTWLEMSDEERDACPVVD